MSYHTPERKAELLFKSYFGSISGLAVRTRFSGAEKSLPELVILCTECEPRDLMEQSGALLPASWACFLTFTIRTRYIKDDQAEGEAHDVFVGAIGDMIADQTIIAGLNDNASDYDCTANLWRVGSRKTRVNDKDLETELSGMLLLVPSAT